MDESKSQIADLSVSNTVDGRVHVNFKVNMGWLSGFEADFTADCARKFAVLSNEHADIADKINK